VNFEPSTVFASVVFDEIAASPCRSSEEITRVGDEYRAWHRLPWYRKLMFWNAPPSRPLNFVEMVRYQTFQEAPIFKRILSESLYPESLFTPEYGRQVSVEFLNCRR
jgi:hypothetical protein